MPKIRFVPLAVLTLIGWAVCLQAQDRRGPFTHDPRSVRSRDVDQQHVRLELKFDWKRREMQGRALHTMTPFKPVRSVTLDAAEMQISGVAGLASPEVEKLKFAAKNNKLIITLDREYKPGEKIQLAVDYVVRNPRYGAHFVVPDKSEPDQQKMVWTQSEPEYAHYWFPCIDSPADRLTSEIVATVPGEFYVLSNGSLQSRTPNEDGTQTWHWVQRKSHVPYLFSVVAGEFEVLKQDWQGVPVESFVPKGRLDDAARSFEKTPAMMQLFSEKIGFRYPWPKYAQICVDEYNWGGMEHTSATTLNVSTLHDKRAHLDTSSDGLVAHELAHQWFGDLMTCKDWAELWLNESFATFFQIVWAEKDLGDDEAKWQAWTQADRYLKEAKRYQRPIVSYQYNQPGNMFDSHSYPKGSRVLYMLRFELGEELFWRAINRYTEVNQFRTVETADLRIAVEEATGQSMTWFFDQWIHHGGHPEFEFSWTWDDEAKLVRVKVKQTQKADAMTPVFRTSAEIEIASPGNMAVRRVKLSKAEHTFDFQWDERPSRVCFDPNDWLLKTLKSEKSKEEWLDQLAYDKHMLCRYRAAGALAQWAKHDDVRDALVYAARQDSFWSVRQVAAKSLAKFKGEQVRNKLNVIARTDVKSKVREEAVKSLSNFSHDETRGTLRHLIEEDPSYATASQALRTLVKVDRKNCKADLLAALDRSSHQESILQAAVDGLVQLKDLSCEARLYEMLQQKISPKRRVIVIGALAKLNPESDKARDLLFAQLDNDRRQVRQSAVTALTKVGGSSAIAALQTRRGKEPSQRLIEKIDEAIKEIETKQRDQDKLRQQVDSLRKQNQSLEERIKKLEETRKE